MSSLQVLEIVAEIMEVDSVAQNLELNEYNWDSLSIISFIAEVHGRMGQLIDAKSVNEAKTVADLIAIVN
jgi:acyl carrier protein